MIVPSSSRRSPSLVFLPFFTGRKPSKANRGDGSPLTMRAGSRADAPGTVFTGIPASSAEETTLKAGSEIPGVPASETSAIDDRSEEHTSELQSRLHLA